MLDAQS